MTHNQTDGMTHDSATHSMTVHTSHDVCTDNEAGNTKYCDTGSRDNDSTYRPPTKDKEAADDTNHEVAGMTHDSTTHNTSVHTRTAV